MTLPLAVTVATVVLDDVHVTELVTFSVEPSDRVAVALNCADAPNSRLVGPVTEMDATVGSLADSVSRAVADIP